MGAKDWPPKPDADGFYEWKGRKYKTNGCTGVPDGDWLDCCTLHDHSYVRGGGVLDRFRADWNLGHCIYCIGRKRGWLWAVLYALIGLTYFFGCRLFGSILWKWRFKRK